MSTPVSTSTTLKPASPPKPILKPPGELPRYGWITPPQLEAKGTSSPPKPGSRAEVRANTRVNRGQPPSAMLPKKQAGWKRKPIQVPKVKADVSNLTGAAVGTEQQQKEVDRPKSAPSALVRKSKGKSKDTLAKAKIDQAYTSKH